MNRPLAVFIPVLLTCSAFAGGFTFEDAKGDHLDVLRDGRVVARYMYASDNSTPARREETYKPYLHVFDAEGKAPITKGPGGQFPHHRAIYIGWNKLNVAGKVYDRWHMKGGEQIHTKFLVQKAGADDATFTSLVRWTGDKAEDTVIEEERTFTFRAAPAPAYLHIETASKLKAVGGETKLDGDPEHSGLQFRPVDTVDKKVTTYLYPVANANPHKDRDYPWVAETFGIGEKKYSVVYLNHPENTKDAACSAYRDYGRFGFWFKGTIPAGATQTVRAAFVIAEGEMLPVEAIQKAWNAYSGKNEPVPTVTTLPAEGAKPGKSNTKKPEPVGAK